MSASGPAGERLQKVLAHAGVASRRAAEELIQAGRVAVDGVVVTELGTRVDPARARITVDGEPLRAAQAAGEERVTYLLNKPMGVVSTADDPQGRSTVVEYELIEAKPWPPEGPKEAVNRYERERKRRKASERRGDDA